MRSTCSSLRDLDQLGRRIADREAAARVEAALGELVAELLQVVAVVADLLGLAELEIVEMPRRPPVGHVHEQQPRAASAAASCSMCVSTARSASECSMATRMWLYMSSPQNVCQSSQTLRPAISTATGQASATIHFGATRSPILRDRP